MFMFVPKFNFLIICENMKKSLNNKNHFPFFHCHLIVIFFTWSYTLTILLLPSGEATCRWLSLQGNTIIIVPVKDMVFLEMLWGERSTRKKKNLQLKCWNWAFSAEVSLLFELMESIFWTTDSYMYMKSFFPGTT